MKDRSTIVVDVKDRTSELTIPAQPYVIVEGPSANERRPLVYGECYNVPLVLLDDATHKWQIADGAIEAVLEVRVNGKVTVDYTTDLSAGTITFNNDPNGEPLVDVQGLKIDGTYYDTPAEIVKELLTRSSAYEQGIAQAGASSTITLAEEANESSDHYNGSTLSIVAGTGSGQSETINDYDGTTKVATMASAWSTTPDSTSVYEIDQSVRVGPVDVGDVDQDALNELPEYSIGIIATELTVREALDQIVGQSLTGYVTSTRAGSVIVSQLEEPAGYPVLSLTAGDYEERSIEIEPDECLAWRVRVFARRNWQQLSQIDATLTEAEFRELVIPFRHVASSADYGTKRNFRGIQARDLAVCSVITATADADTEAERVLELRKAPRWYYRVEARSGLFQVRPGEEISLAHPRWLPTPKNLIARRLRDGLLSNSVQIEGWG